MFSTAADSAALVWSQMAVFGGLGSSEIIIILVVMLLLFGPKRLPELARAIGSSVNEFKDALTGRPRDPAPPQPPAPGSGPDTKNNDPGKGA